MTTKIQYKFYALTFPSEFTIEQTLDFFDSLQSGLSRGGLLTAAENAVFETWSDKDGLKHRIGFPWQHTELKSQLRTLIPGVSVDEDERPKVRDWNYALELGVSDNLRQFRIERANSQVKRLLGSMVTDDMKEDDTVLVQWVFAPGDNIQPPGETSEVISSHFRWAALWQGVSANKDEVADRRANARQNQFRAVLRVAAFSSTDSHARKLVENVKAAFKVPETADVRFTDQWYFPLTKKRERINRCAPPPVHPKSFINATEASVFSTWPIGAPIVKGLRIGKTQYLPPNQNIIKDGRRLGLSYEDRPVAIGPDDACRHMFVSGPSGVGKTTLLANSLQQDIERGYGAVVLESKGDLFHAALNAVPRERLDDVVVIDLTDSEWPVGFNPLQGVNKVKAIDDLIALFSEGAGNDIYFSDIMYHALNTLCLFPELTLADLVPFLSPSNPVEKAWRDSLINRIPKSSDFYYYWKNHDNLKESERRQRVGPVLNRFMKFTNRRDIRNMLGQSESSIDMRSIMRDNKLLFVYIPDSLGEKTVSLLTSLLFKEAWDAVRAVKGEKKTPTYLYLDEVWKLKGYINLPEILSLARSFQFGTVMALQYRSQLDVALQSAISNAATMVAFRQDGAEAKWMETVMGKPATADDYMSLESYEAIAKVAMGGSSSAPTFMKTLAPIPPHNLGDEVVKQSRAKYGRRAADVDAAILRRRSAPKEKKRERPTFGVVMKGDDDE